MPRRRASRPPKLDTDNRKIGLSSEDNALWDKVTARVTPLKSRHKASPPPAHQSVPLARRSETPHRSHSPSHRRADFPGHISHRPTVDTNPSSPPGLERRLAAGLAKGRVEIDRKVDLHGENQDSAFRRLRAAVLSAYHSGERYVLVVTGKGGRRFAQRGEARSAAYRARADFNLEGGVLKRMVPLWLASADLSPYVSGVAPAAPGHGGAGALYVRIRRRK